MFFLKKNYKKILLLFCLSILLAYVSNITSIPNSIILFQNEDLNLETVLGIKIEETVQVGAGIVNKEEINNTSQEINNIQKEKISKKTYNLSLFGINLKTISANVIQNKRVILGGELVGLKLYTKGVLVVGMSEIKGQDGQIYKPFEESGIEEGDSIIKINNEEVNNTEELISCVSKNQGKILKISYLQDGNQQEANITPIKTSENTYKIGLWVRDAAAGVGTLTFYDRSTNSIATLGHGIQDVDTGELVEISSGELVTAKILDIEKGEENNPGKIEGTIENGDAFGEIYSNTEYGVYGTISDESKLDLDKEQEVEVASRNEIETGKASIICTLEDGVKEEYEVEIKKIYLNNNKDNKSMVVKVTDEKLIEKTGGIVQGMSGSPIIQNGKLIGALTHVLVSNPAEGYGVFADMMLNEIIN